MESPLYRFLVRQVDLNMGFAVFGRPPQAKENMFGGFPSASIQLNQKGVPKKRRTHTPICWDGDGT